MLHSSSPLDTRQAAVDEEFNCVLELPVSKNWKFYSNAGLLLLYQVKEFAIRLAQFDEQRFKSCRYATTRIQDFCSKCF